MRAKETKSNKKGNKNMRNRFEKGTGCFKCSECGKKTRDIGDNGMRGLCPECDEIGDLEVRLSDGDMTQEQFDNWVEKNEKGILVLRKKTVNPEEGKTMENTVTGTAASSTEVKPYEPGRIYLNKFGTPVKFIGPGKGGHVLEICETGKKITVAADYELKETEQKEQPTQQDPEQGQSETIEFRGLKLSKSIMKKVTELSKKLAKIHPEEEAKLWEEIASDQLAEVELAFKVAGVTEPELNIVSKEIAEGIAGIYGYFSKRGREAAVKQYGCLLVIEPVKKAKTQKDADKPKKQKQSKSDSSVKKVKLSDIIDEYLLQGKFTVKQIAEAIKDTWQAQDKNVKANIHARIVAHKRQGHGVTKTAEKVYIIGKPEAK